MSFALIFHKLPNFRGLVREVVTVGHGATVGTIERGAATARLTTPGGRSKLFLVEDLDERLRTLSRKLDARSRTF